MHQVSRLFFLFFFSPGLSSSQQYFGGGGGGTGDDSKPSPRNKNPTCQRSQLRGKKHSVSVVESCFKIAVQYYECICACGWSMLYSICVFYNPDAYSPRNMSLTMDYLPPLVVSGDPRDLSVADQRGDCRIGPPVDTDWAGDCMRHLNTV